MSEVGRNIAFCVSKWSHQSCVLTWAWLRQSFLRPGVDRLFIVHNGKHEKWRAGGPLGPDLDTALENWPHEIFIVDGSIQSNIDAFVDKHAIDVVVLSEDYPGSGLQMTSVSEWVKQHIKVPFIIIRSAAVRNDKLRLNPGGEGLSPTASVFRPTYPEDTATHARKIAICYSSFAVGTQLMQLAKELVLTPRDEIFVIHCFPTEAEQNKVLQQTKKIVRTVTLQRIVTKKPAPAPLERLDLTEENIGEFGACELAGFNVHLNVALRGDVKSAVTAFCEAESIDLLVIGTRATGKIRKTLGGGSVSGYLIDHAPCPSLVIPYRSMGLLNDEELLSPMSSLKLDGDHLAAAAPLSPQTFSSARPGLMSASEEQQLVVDEVSALKLELEAKDRLIAQLQAELRELKGGTF